MWNLRPKTLKSAKKMNFLKQIGDDDNRREVNKLKKRSQTQNILIKYNTSAKEKTEEHKKKKPTPRDMYKHINAKIYRFRGIAYENIHMLAALNPIKRNGCNNNKK